MTRSTSRAIAASAIALFIAACAIAPLEERPPSEIRSLLDKPPPPCSDNAAGSPTECAKEHTRYYDRVRQALAAAHAADLAAAPECLRSIDIPAEYFEAAHMDPGTPNALAEMITQGYVLSRVVKTPQCAAEVCQWRTKEEPKKNSGYCSTGTRRTATKGSPRASRQLQAFSPDRESKEGASRAR
jgi:hypothetical protein